MTRHGHVGLVFLLFIQWTLAENFDGTNDAFVSIRQQLSRLTETVRELTRRDEVQTQEILELERELEMKNEKQSEKIEQLQREMTKQNVQLIQKMELEMNTQTEKLERELETLRKQSVEKDLQDLENSMLVKQLNSEIDKLKQLAEDGVENGTVYNDNLMVSNNRFEGSQNVQPDIRKDYKNGRDGVNGLQKTNDTVNRSSNGSSRRTRAGVTQVAFSATIKQHDYGPLGANQVVRFDSVLSNIGNSYHPHSGIFTAPVSGTYVISATISCWKHSVGHSYLQIKKNGDEIGKIWAGTGDQSTQVVVINLLANDEIYVTNSVASDIILGDTYTFFGGFLLYANGVNG